MIGSSTVKRHEWRGGRGHGRDGNAGGMWGMLRLTVRYSLPLSCLLSSRIELYSIIVQSLVSHVQARCLQFLINFTIIASLLLSELSWKCWFQYAVYNWDTLVNSRGGFASKHKCTKWCTKLILPRRNNDDIVLRVLI